MLTFNPSTREAKAGRSLSSRPAWTREGVPGQAPKPHTETLSRKKEKKNCTAQEVSNEKEDSIGKNVDKGFCLSVLSQCNILCVLLT